jgi:hypothetical protein
MRERSVYAMAPQSSWRPTPRADDDDRERPLVAPQLRIDCLGSGRPCGGHGQHRKAECRHERARNKIEYRARTRGWTKQLAKLRVPGSQATL